MQRHATCSCRSTATASRSTTRSCGWDNWIDAFKNFSSKIRAEVSIMVPRDVARLARRRLRGGARSRPHRRRRPQHRVAATSSPTGSPAGSRSTRSAARSSSATTRARSGSTPSPATSSPPGRSRASTPTRCRGSVQLDATGVPDAVRVNTVSGAVTARFDAGCRRQLHDQHGGRPTAARQHLDPAPAAGTPARHGDLDKHWTDVRINTVGGDINVLHSVRS